MHAQNNIKLQSPEPQLFAARALSSDGYVRLSETRQHLFGIPQDWIFHNGLNSLLLLPGLCLWRTGHVARTEEKRKYMIFKERNSADNIKIVLEIIIVIMWIGLMCKTVLSLFGPLV